jgi:hypothetical protein
MHDFLGGKIFKMPSNKTKLTGIFFDLSKACDILNHNILLSKLQACGIRHIAYL